MGLIVVIRLTRKGLTWFSLGQHHEGEPFTTGEESFSNEPTPKLMGP